MWFTDDTNTWLRATQHRRMHHMFISPSVLWTYSEERHVCGNGVVSFGSDKFPFVHWQNDWILLSCKMIERKTHRNWFFPFWLLQLLVELIIQLDNTNTYEWQRTRTCVIAYGWTEWLNLLRLQFAVDWHPVRLEANILREPRSRFHDFYDFVPLEILLSIFLELQTINSSQVQINFQIQEKKYLVINLVIIIFFIESKHKKIKNFTRISWNRLTFDRRVRNVVAVGMTIVSSHQCRS